MKNSLFNPVLWLVASLSLGLAPFFPEPHIWEKIRWIATGQFPLEGIYVFDTFLHGMPWVMLIVSVVMKLKSRTSQA